MVNLSQMNHQQRDIGWGDAADPACLREIGGPNMEQFFAGLGAQLPEAVVVEMSRYPLFRQSMLAVDLGLLPGDVASILDVESDLLGHLGG